MTHRHALSISLLSFASLVAQSIACTVGGQPPEATDKGAAPLVGASDSGQPGALVPPNQAVQFPRSVALQGPNPVTVVHHQGIASGSGAGGPK